MKPRRRPTHAGRFLVLLAGVLATASLVAPFTVGSAARLEVRAVAPLQVFVFDVDIEEPDPEPEPETGHTVMVLAHRFNSGNNTEVGGSPTTATFTIADGQSYALSWDGAEIVDCSSVDHTVGDGHVEDIDGTYVAEADRTHEFCAQTGNGDITLTEVDPESSG